MDILAKVTRKQLQQQEKQYKEVSHVVTEIGLQIIAIDLNYHPVKYPTYLDLNQTKFDKWQQQ